MVSCYKHTILWACCSTLQSLGGNHVQVLVLLLYEAVGGCEVSTCTRCVKWGSKVMVLTDLQQLQCKPRGVVLGGRV